MKKKAIEKIPYLMLPACDPDEKVLYVGRVAWRNVGHERHIILEMYKNREECLQVPVVRYTATKKDWGIYEPGTGSWSRRRIESNIWVDGMCWYDGRINRYSTYDEMMQANRLYSEDDLSKIKKFFHGIKIWNDKRWWEYFSKNEVKIENKKMYRKYERRKERLRERERNTPKLDEKALLDWADDNIFRQKHYLYYKKYGRRADLCCSACGGTYSGVWKEGISYESRFERYIQEPREGLAGSCILCKKTGIYKPQGKVGKEDRIKGHVFMADKYMENGVVLRYIEVGKEWRLEKVCGEKGLEMCGAYEELYGIEIARTYFLPGQKIQTDFHKHNNWSGRDVWDDCNLYGNANINIDKGEVHPETFRNIEGTFLQYSALKEYVSVQGKVNVRDYLERYTEFPQIEMMVKMGMYQVAEQMIKGYCGLIMDSYAKRPDRFLGIRKDKVKLLAAEQGDMQILRVLQEEKRLVQNWSWQQVRDLAELGVAGKNLETALQVMSVQKFLNNISKYAGCGYGTRCSRAEARLKAAATTYLDYLQMCRSLGYDLDNTVYQKPRDIETAHNQMVMESNKGKVEKRLKEVSEKFPDIKKNYRKLRKRYFYEDNDFLIRPARSAEEIVTEGRMLHHCVGGDSYLSRHNRGDSYILMLRIKEMPEIPYITVEIDRTDRIMQWYGKHDKKTDEENMQKWLDIYVTRLKAGKLHAEKETTEGAEEQMLMEAV